MRIQTKLLKITRGTCVYFPGTSVASMSLFLMTDGGLDVVFDPPSAFVYECHPKSLKRAITNLVENAVKYGKQAHVFLEQTDSAINIYIEDTGPGIPDGEFEKVFSPFYRLERSRHPDTGGVGLGLSIARTIIHAHGGRILLSNREHGGLRVAIKLPRSRK